MADLTEIATTTAELIDSIEEDAAEMEITNIGVVAVVVEFSGEVDGKGWTDVQYRCSDDRRWIQAGLFEAAKRGALGGGKIDEDDDD